MPERNMYRRGETWWLRASVDGIEYRESLRTSNLRDARARRDRRIKEIEEARWIGEKRSWLQAVVAYREGASVGPSTLKRYAVSLDQCRPFLEQHAVSAIDGAVIMSLIAQRRKVASNATVRRDLTAISRVLEYAEAHGWREGNPTLSKRKLYKERRDPIVLPEPADIEAVIARCGARLGALVRAAWLTGCRQNELVTAEWRGFNARARTLEVVGKGNKRRTIQLSDEAARHILGTARTMGSDLIFCNEDGRPFDNPSSTFGRIRRRVEKANPGFRRFRFHDLRHYFSVEALRGGMDLWTLSKHLGHTSVALTERVYLTFLTPEEADRARKAKVA